MVGIIEPCLCKVDIQHHVIGMPGKDSRRKVPVVIGYQLAGTGHRAPNIILQLGEGLAVILGVIPDVAHVVVDVGHIPVVAVGDPNDPAVFIIVESLGPVKGVGLGNDAVQGIVGVDVGLPVVVHQSVGGEAVVSIVAVVFVVPQTVGPLHQVTPTDRYPA